jgi:hypothetical protein
VLIDITALHSSCSHQGVGGGEAAVVVEIHETQYIVTSVTIETLPKLNICVKFPACSLICLLVSGDAGVTVGKYQAYLLPLSTKLTCCP